MVETFKEGDQVTGPFDGIGTVTGTYVDQVTRVCVRLPRDSGITSDTDEPAFAPEGLRHVEIPWKDAEIHEGITPQAASLFPLPVILECRKGEHLGYWYPEDDRIDVSRARCYGYGGTWSLHDWEVLDWNGNNPVEAPTVTTG